ncbi:MAG TPA: glycosyltransferase family 39 protein [Gemmataceae bacterium]|nr:glycosyltransferase family 39 protein [Gemmataceae bacterium]
MSNDDCRKNDLKSLAILVLIAVALRGWLLLTTEVAARDSIGYIRYALELENPQMTWGQVLCKNHQHPGFPAAIWAVSQPVRAVLGFTPFSMQLSAQLVSAIAAVLLVIPMFYLGKNLLNRQTGFWGALLFQFLPISGHLLSDGCSEALYLLLFASAMLAGVNAIQGNSPWRFGVCGCLCGLAYLIRPEGAIVFVATGLVLVGMQCIPAWRRSWFGTFACAASLAISALLVGSLYFAFTHQFTNKPAGQHVLDLHIAKTSEVLETSEACCAVPGSPLFASIWAVHVDATGATRLGAGPSLRMLAIEIVQGFHYVGGLAVLLGLWWYRGLLRTQPGIWVLAAVCGLYCFILFRLGMAAGYISDRHVMVLILCGCYPAATALREIPLRWSARAQERGSATAPSMLGALGLPRFRATALLLMLAFCLPKTLQPLHANRAGHHAAGRWLEQHVKPGDQVVDDHCWAHYYAGLVFEEGKTYPATIQPVRYTVIGRTRDPRDDKGRTKQESSIRAAGGHVVYSWPPGRSAETAKVVVYMQSKPGDSR